MDTLIREALRSVAADYVEIRIHEGAGTTIRYSGKELEDIGESTALGGCVRVLLNGGWGFASFNDLRHLKKYVRMAREQAALVGDSGVKLAPVEPQVAEVTTRTDIDPADVPLEEKQRICDRYNRMILGTKGIQTSSVSYRDSVGRVYFANTEGSFIVQETKFCGITAFAIAKDGMNVQRAFETIGDLRGFKKITAFEEACERVAKRAVDLLSATPVKAGVYTVIVDPRLCGVFVHEAFGHLSEADHIHENEKLREMMVPGRRFGGDHLSIVDEGNMEGEAGYIAYDSEGTPSRKTYLIRDGVLVSRLHSRETAAKMGEEPTGNARALGHSFQPIVRMTNTYMEPRDWSFDKMLEDTAEGIYAIGALGGQTNTEMFTFSAEEAYEIKGGKLGRKLRDVVLTGNVFETLANIDAIGDDLKIFGGMGGCGKDGQSPLRVGDGGPHARIRNVTIGGR